VTNVGGSNSKVKTSYITVMAPVTPMPTATETNTPTPTFTGPNSSIIIQNFTFSPASLPIQNGTTVTWTNQDTAPHQPTSDSGPVSFSSDPLAQGASFIFMFTTPGTYTYHCAIHPSMTGTIVVQES